MCIGDFASRLRPIDVDRIFRSAIPVARLQHSRHDLVGGAPELAAFEKVIVTSVDRAEAKGRLGVRNGARRVRIAGKVAVGVVGSRIGDYVAVDIEPDFGQGGPVRMRLGNFDLLENKLEIMLIERESHTRYSSQSKPNALMPRHSRARHWRLKSVFRIRGPRCDARSASALTRRRLQDWPLWRLDGTRRAESQRVHGGSTPTLTARS